MWSKAQMYSSRFASNKSFEEEEGESLEHTGPLIVTSENKSAIRSLIKQRSLDIIYISFPMIINERYYTFSLKKFKHDNNYLLIDPYTKSAKPWLDIIKPLDYLVEGYSNLAPTILRTYAKLVIQYLKIVSSEKMMKTRINFMTIGRQYISRGLYDSVYNQIQQVAVETATLIAFPEAIRTAKSSALSYICFKKLQYSSDAKIVEYFYDMFNPLKNMEERIKIKISEKLKENPKFDYCKEIGKYPQLRFVASGGTKMMYSYSKFVLDNLKDIMISEISKIKGISEYEYKIKVNRTLDIIDPNYKLIGD